MTTRTHLGRGFATLALLLSSFAAQAQVHLLVSTNGALLGPSSFFSANEALIEAAIGTFPGGQVGTGISGDNITAGTVADSRIAATIARLASPALTGTPTTPTASANSSNTVVASTAYVDRAVAANPGGGGGSSITNLAQLIVGLSTNDIIAWTGAGWVVTNRLYLDEILAGSLSLSTPIGFASGGHGGTNAASARANLGLTIGTDVQAQSARLSDIAGISYATGDILYWNGSALVRMPIGTNGQVLGVSGGSLAYLNQSGGSGGVTNYSALSDVTVTSPVEGQVPVYNGTTGKWNNRTPATNPLLVNWIGAYGLGTATNFATATNNVLAVFSIPPSASPGASGRYIQGESTTILGNTNTFSASYDFVVDLNGTRVIDATRSYSGNSQEMQSLKFRIVWESGTTASVVLDGAGPSLSTSPTTGIGGYHHTTTRSTFLLATNVAFTWANTNQVTISVGMRNTGGGTASGISVQRISASLYAMKDDSTFTSPTFNDRVTFEQSTLAAHSASTNYVVDPTVSYYQRILCSAQTDVRFLHATNVAAGRGTVVLVDAGTNATVTVVLGASQFASHTNRVTLSAGQILPVSFYGFGAANTNVLATMANPAAYQ